MCKKVIVSILSLAFLVLCMNASMAQSDSKKEGIRADSQEAKAAFLKEDPEMSKFLTTPMVT